MKVWKLSAAMALAAISSASQAETANMWRVNGAISGRTFILDCRLEQTEGACSQVSSGAKSMRLTSFAEAGNQLNWSLRTRVAIMNITLAFNGRVSGDRMSGTMTAAGRSGTFTAVRR